MVRSRSLRWPKIPLQMILELVEASGIGVSGLTIVYLEYPVGEILTQQSVRNDTGQGDTRGRGRRDGVGRGRDGGAKSRGRGEVVVSRLRRREEALAERVSER